LGGIGLVGYDSAHGGLPPVASKSRLWLARPGEHESDGDVFPIDWCGITQRGSTATNYQILPGDRIYVAAIPAVTADTWIGRAIAPSERFSALFGNVVLG